MKGKTSGQKMLLTAGFMAMATLLSKVLGLVRDSLLTAYFGSGLESDAFLTASTIPTTLFDVIIGGVISAGFIPVFNDIMSNAYCLYNLIYRWGRNNFQRCTCEHTSTELYS